MSGDMDTALDDAAEDARAEGENTTTDDDGPPGDEDDPSASDDDDSSTEHPLARSFLSKVAPIPVVTLGQLPELSMAADEGTGGVSGQGSAKRNREDLGDDEKSIKVVKKARKKGSIKAKRASKDPASEGQDEGTEVGKAPSKKAQETGSLKRKRASQGPASEGKDKGTAVSKKAGKKAREKGAQVGPAE